MEPERMTSERQIELLRRAFGARTQRPSGEACAGRDEIWRAVAGELAAPQRRKIVDHLAACAVCAEEWRLAVELGASDASATRDSTATKSPRHSWQLAAAALAVLLAGALAWRMNGPAVEEPAVYRDLSGSGIRSLVPQEVPLAPHGLVLRWEGGFEADSYTLRLSDDRLETLALLEGLEEPEARIDPAPLARLAPGARLLWQVEAKLPDGRRLVSPTFVNRLE
ncbi:MAG: hypothetical protein R3325_03230 [Thermoanaerobaculia bacterium]|nr:hypothetical protein [Thermoanaerobaculia bacterium]